MAAPVTVQNTQKAVRVCERTLAEHAGLLRKILGVDDYALGVWLATNQEIKELNRDYRGKDKATDVLSFPLFKVKPGSLPPKRSFGGARRKEVDMGFAASGVPLSPSSTSRNTDHEYDDSEQEHPELGDIVLGMPYIKKYCEKKGILMEEHIPHLLSHGLVHLLGYDHENDQDYELMKAKEDEVMMEFWIQLARLADERGLSDYDSVTPDELPEKQRSLEQEIQAAEEEFKEYQLKELKQKPSDATKQLGGRKKPWNQGRR